MERFFKQHFWIVHLVVLALCATFAGRAAAHLVEANLLADDEPAPHHVRAYTPPPLPHLKDPGDIIARNIFCSGCMPPKAKAAEAKEEASREPQKTSLQLALIGVLLAPEESLSRAVIRDLSTPQKDSAMFAQGNELFATGAVVVHVYARRVYLRNDKELEYLDLDDAPAPPPRGPTPAPPIQIAGNDSFATALDHGLSCSGSGCQIDRSLVEQALRNTTMLATSARFVPAIRDGRPLGFRVFAIRPGSLFARLGMTNGDTILAINGNDMSTPDQALALYSKLRNASHLSLELDRRGSRQTLDYVIR